MSCCGGKRTSRVNRVALDIPMVKAMYSTTNVSPEPVYGLTKVLGGRSIKYGRKRHGDVFNVAIDDVRKQPDKFVAPCGEPFTFDSKGGIINPCEDEPVAPEIKHGADLTEIPGVGPATAEKFAEAGLYTHEDIRGLTEEQLIDLKVPPLSRKKIKEWQS
jgi:hypothetical protein